MKKNIAFLLETFQCGGVETIVANIGSYLSKRGLNIFVIAKDITPENFTTEINDSLHYITLENEGVFYSKENALALIEIINSHHIEILCSHVHIKHIEFIKKQTGVTYVFTNHGMPLWEKTGKMIKAELNRNTLSGIFKYAWVKCANNRFYSQYTHRFRKLYQEAYNASAVYTVLCNGYKTDIERLLHITAENSHIQVINNPSLVHNIGKRTPKKTILYLGRMSFDDKRVDRLLRIWKKIQDKLPEWDLTLVGDGPNMEQYQSMAASLHLERYNFVGYTKNTYTYLQTASILCLTSSFEGWPLCLVEAMAYGIPCIAFDCSEGVHEILKPSGENGILVPPFDEDLFAQAILLLANNPKLRKNISANAKKKTQQWSIDTIGEQWFNLFSTC